VDTVDQLDCAAVGDYLGAHLDGFRGPLTATKFATGQSNPTFLLEAPSGRYVLRRKPPGQLLKSAHAVDREFRVITALQGTDVPVPRPHLLCADESVIGTMFFVMEFCAGRNFQDPRVPEVDATDRAAIYDDMNRVLAALHSVDIEAVGLADYGRPGNYFERQIGRWTQQYRASETETIAAMDALIAWLAGNTPADDGRIALVHGDYRIDNMIFDARAPRMIAVLDWELSTLGHPFADLGYQCMQWRMPTGPVGRGLDGVDRTALGIPSEADYVAKYCERMGIAAIPDWPFYLAFAFFRLAAIIQGVKKRGLDGNASNPERAAELGTLVPVLAAKAVELVN
jgi:aminoglycoside phosphotransferase (APT) family kinase protein